MPLLIMLLLLLTLSFSAVFSVVFSANACCSGFFSCSCSVFACCKVLLLYCWRVFSFRFFFCCEIGWAIDRVDCVCDCDCGCGAGGADVAEAVGRVDVVGLDLASRVSIRVVRPLIISINWSIFAFINDGAGADMMFSWVEAPRVWFRVGMISTGLMKGSIIAPTVDTSMPFRGFFWSRWIR